MVESSSGFKSDLILRDQKEKGFLTGCHHCMTGLFEVMFLLRVPLNAMETKAKKNLIERFVRAYNSFDVDGMMALMHPECSFQNISGVR